MKKFICEDVDDKGNPIPGSGCGEIPYVPFDGYSFGDRMLEGVMFKVYRGERLTDEIQHARLDCLIFFFLVEMGWGRAVVLPSGAKVAVDAPASSYRRLGNPTRYRLWTASKRVHQTCAEQATCYKQALREWRESCRRYLATETEKSWRWYVAGKGNRNSVAYRTKVDLSHSGGENHFRTRRGFRYMAHELLPRGEERRRARREMRAAEAIMRDMRHAIFDQMRVPEKFRAMA